MCERQGIKFITLTDQTPPNDTHLVIRENVKGAELDTLVLQQRNGLAREAWAAAVGEVR